MKQGKIWGQTAVIESNPQIEVHRIQIDLGGKCSKHVHQVKWNGFLVLSGQIIVRVWQPNGLVDETTLHPGDYTKVPPGQYHQFQCVHKADALEFYWAQMPAEDIDRETTGTAVLCVKSDTNLATQKPTA